MQRARNAGSAAVNTAAIGLLTILLAVNSAGAEQTKKTTFSSKKRSAVVAASRRTPTKISSTTVALNRRSRSTASREEVSHRTALTGTRKVVVTRKMVHGHWVRTTQIVRAPSGPSFQTHPDTERYQQIQQALVSNGYFKGEANGTWGDDSVAALKQFQTDRKLVNDGRISSLSLIGLGLGPTRESETKPIADSTPAPLPPAPAEPSHN